MKKSTPTCHTADLWLGKSGAVRWGHARLHRVPGRDMDALCDWLAKGCNAGMDYMARNIALRSDPELLLPGARTVISLAFNYYPESQRVSRLPGIAWFAYGEDYHDVLRKRLRESVAGLEADLGGEYRICIDSAPVMERYWAEQCGVGKRFANGLIGVEGYGTTVFLAEILTSAPPESFNGMAGRPEEAYSGGDSPNRHAVETKRAARGSCCGCGKCREACPAGALDADGRVDARRCLSYLTVEHRGVWDGTGHAAMETPQGRNTLFGCDICQKCCPANKKCVPTRIPQFSPNDVITTLTAGDVAGMDLQSFAMTFKGSAIKRAKLAGLTRNALNILEADS